MTASTSLPDHWRILFWRIEPLDAAVYVGFLGAGASLKAQDWAWTTPAYQLAVAYVLFVLAADRVRGEQLGRHGLVLWSGVTLACGTAFAQAFELVVTLMGPDRADLVPVAVAGLYVAFSLPMMVVNALRRRATERDEVDDPLPLPIERTTRARRGAPRRARRRRVTR